MGAALQEAWGEASRTREEANPKPDHDPDLTPTPIPTPTPNTYPTPNPNYPGLVKRPSSSASILQPNSKPSCMSPT